MRLTDFRDVLDELWERIEPLLAPFKRKRSGGSKPLSQRTILAEILYKCRSGANGPCFPPAMAQKVLSAITSNAGVKPVSWRKFFAYTLRNMGKSRRGCPMASYGRHLAASPDALLKKSAAEGLGATQRTEAKWRQDPSPCGRSGYSSGSDGHRRQCA